MPYRGWMIELILLGKKNVLDDRENPGYWQIEMDAKDVNMTAFMTHNRLYRYTRMLFEFKNATKSSQKAMHVILASFKFKCVIFQIDEVIIFSKSLEKYVTHVDKILGLVIHFEMKLELKLKKCHFFSKSIDYLKHVIASGKLKVARTTNNAVKLLLYSEDIYQMKSVFRL